MIAAEHGNADCVRLLLDAGASTNNPPGKVWLSVLLVYINFSHIRMAHWLIFDLQVLHFIIPSKIA